MVSAEYIPPAIVKSLFEKILHEIALFRLFTIVAVIAADNYRPNFLEHLHQKAFTHAQRRCCVCLRFHRNRIGGQFVEFHIQQWIEYVN